jgi:hypothetical protein
MIEKNIVVFLSSDSRAEGVNICDSKGERHVNNAEFTKIKKECTLINLSRKRGSTKTLKEFYDYVIKCDKELKNATKGKINLKKTGYFSKTSYMTWNIMKKQEIKDLVPEDLTKLEVQILDKTKGSIIFSEKGYKGEGHYYDFNSFYPSIMQEKMFLIPYKQPKALTIKTLSQAYWENAEGNYYLKYGFFRCIIEKSGIEETDRLFRFQDDNWYCSQDITLAKLLKLKIKMIDDGEVNFLHYDRTKCVTGYKLFGAFINYMFKFKQNKVTGAKDILNSLWGYICQKKMTKKKNSETPIKIIPSEDGLLAFFEKENPYNPFARLKKVLLAEGRLQMVKTIIKYGKDIVQAHTDGFISKKKLDDITTSTNLGCIKYDGCKQVHIVNANKIEVIE